MAIKRSFYNRTTADVAKDLLGKKLVRVIDGQQIVSVITETEAYQATEPSCHAHRGKTERNASLFGPVGHTYVYFTYGMHFCVNIVARDTDACHAGGVLIRAVMPVEGMEIIKNFRPKHKGTVLGGPGIVTQALNINRTHGGIDVTSKNSSLFITEGIIVDPQSIISTPRIGISKAQDLPWRFIITLS